MEKIVYTVKEVANLLDIGTAAAYQLTHSEGFPHIKVGKRIVVPIEAFHVWVKERTKNGYLGDC